MTPKQKQEHKGQVAEALARKEAAKQQVAQARIALDLAERGMGEAESAYYRINVLVPIVARLPADLREHLLAPPCQRSCALCDRLVRRHLRERYKTSFGSKNFYHKTRLGRDVISALSEGSNPG